MLRLDQLQTRQRDLTANAGKQLKLETRTTCTPRSRVQRWVLGAVSIEEDFRKVVPSGDKLGTTD